MSSKSEKSIQDRIRAHIGKRPDCRLFRNNTGMAWRGQKQMSPPGMLILHRPVPIKYGLAKGSSDLIGIKSLVVTPEMVGQKVGLFVAIEVKRPGQKPTREQSDFIRMVDTMGGLAGVVDSVEVADVLVGPEEGS